MESGDITQAWARCSLWKRTSHARLVFQCQQGAAFSLNNSQPPADRSSIPTPQFTPHLLPAMEPPTPAPSQDHALPRRRGIFHHTCTDGYVYRAEVLVHVVEGTPLVVRLKAPYPVAVMGEIERWEAEVLAPFLETSLNELALSS